MLGATIGDIIGSRFEKHNHKSKHFELFTSQCRFTDDSVLTWAVAHALLKNEPFDKSLKSFARNYPFAGYGNTFKKWVLGLISGPYHSWGNGSAMRVSPVGYAFQNLERTLFVAEKSASVTHNHPEGIKGAQAIAGAIWLARHGKTKAQIRFFLEHAIGYDLSFTLDEIRPEYRFDVSCQGSVPQAIVAFLEAKDFEDAIRNAISIGGDSDTIASMAGALAEAYWGDIPNWISQSAQSYIPDTQWTLIQTFYRKFSK
ncbi:ADP-ribosylglycohydrolase family protein [Pontibacter sp. G13]|uniref:ADP-ribosylglycohydrolase family protein n=1 Tax=Pontibacter sp. G13 TaxID=3074898 RepID=UPI002889482F|nr:ADP-ribosylglycohydrolase family protein [Pontibacter sp. G13]WNJ18359.1 ADP-ribosylglycohydrolase family protein [Pontibacter sp. G13]